MQATHELSSTHREALSPEHPFYSSAGTYLSTGLAKVHIPPTMVTVPPQSEEMERMREAQRRHFTELKLRYEADLDEKEREMMRLKEKTAKLERDKANTQIQHQTLKDIIAKTMLENTTLAEQINSIQSAVQSINSTFKTDSLHLRDKIAAARAELADQDAHHSLEVRELKRKYACRMQEIKDASELRSVELLREYERLRGAKRLLASELNRLQTTTLEQEISIETRLAEVEMTAALEDKAANDYSLKNSENALTETEQLQQVLEKKIADQQDESQRRKERLLSTVSELESALLSTEESISLSRLALARKQEENKRVGHTLRLRGEQSLRCEEELADLKRTLERLQDIEREKKEAAKAKESQRVAVAESLKGGLHERIVVLEKEIRQAELVLQGKRNKMQKLAEVVSANVNKTIVETLSKHRLNEALGLAVKPKSFLLPGTN